MESPVTTDLGSAGKRKRSDSSSTTAPTAPPAKTAKTGSNQLSINYLARQSPEDLPLITKDDTLPNLLHLLSAYSNILDRHESLASNLGARPLGPILIKRFERCFDAPPKIVASHHKGAGANADDAHHITWLEVIEFARSHPTQFTLSTFSEGRRVCQFYYPQKQLRVQISEEDFLFINSGRCQELIPPLPIWEDEEKEVGTCDVLESRLRELTNAADMIAARTRQLGHRLKGRRAAILERRAEGGSGTPAKAGAVQTTPAPGTSNGGFVAVNNQPASTVNGARDEPTLASSSTVRNDLLKHFESLPHNQSQGRTQSRHHSIANPDQHPHPNKYQETVYNAPQEHNGAPAAPSTTSSISPTLSNAHAMDPMGYFSSADQGARSQMPNQGSSISQHGSSNAQQYSHQTNSHTPIKHNFSRPLPPALESSQPFRPLCQAHMDSLPRGQRVLPPCDRCRRLRMDCVKNLTSCAGCTRKHARCHWRDVSRDELAALDHLMETYARAGAEYIRKSEGRDSASMHGNGMHEDSEDDDDEGDPLEDLEALGEKAERENEARDDEEGLERAKELARLGWEENARGSEIPRPARLSNGQPEDVGVRSNGALGNAVIHKIEEQTENGSATTHQALESAVAGSKVTRSPSNASPHSQQDTHDIIQDHGKEDSGNEPPAPHVPLSWQEQLDRMDAERAEREKAERAAQAVAVNGDSDGAKVYSLSNVRADVVEFPRSPVNGGFRPVNGFTNAGGSASAAATEGTGWRAA